jgi:lysophospholipase L1-like esterase
MKNQMKNLLWIVLPVAAIIVGCTKTPKEPDKPSAKEVEFTASAAIAGVGGAGIEYTWDAGGDRIGVFVSTGDTSVHTNVYYSAFASGATSKFVTTADKNKIWWGDAGSAGYNLVAYYPFRTSYNDPTAIPVSLAAEYLGDGGSTAHLKSAGLMYASVSGAKQADGEVHFDFSTFYGVVRLDVTTNERLSRVSSIAVHSKSGGTMAFESGTLDITTGAIDIAATGATDNITYTFKNPVTISDRATSIYIPVYPGHSGDTFEVSVTVDGETTVFGEVTAPTSGIAAGQLTALALNHEQPNPYPDAIDLSTGGTANTYLVNAAATSYKLKATVRGNGTARTYTWTQDGAPLTGGYTDADLTIAPVEGALVWYNTPKTASGWVKASPVVFESVLLRSDGYLYFTTPDTFVPGNALLAVYDEAGEILWSWNIWAVEGYDPAASARAVGAYTLMDRNLGAIKGSDVMSNSDPREAAAAIGNYYQWGHKEPYPAAADYTAANIGTDSRPMEWGLPTYTPIDALKKNASSESWGSDDMMFTYDYAANAYPMASEFGTSYTVEDAVAASVKYPYRWMSSGTNNNSEVPYLWMSRNENKPDDEKTAWRWLWGNVGGATGQKSIYDPCPAGWMVPDAAAMGLALSTATPSTNGYGYYSPTYNLYFPSAGQRQAAFGGSKISGLSAGGVLMMQTTSSSSYSRDTFLRVNAETSGGAVQGAAITSHNTYISAGYQVRCVSETPRPVTAGGSLAGTKAALVGDSITLGWDNSDDSKGFLAENDFTNFGVNGYTSYNMIFNFNKVIKSDPACVVIAAGTNDIAQNEGYVALEDIVGSIRIMAEWAAAYGSKVVIASVTPSNGFSWKDNSWNSSHDVAASIVTLNTMLREYAASRGFVWLDYHSALKDANNALDPAYWANQNDGTHINAAGYAVMAPLLKAAVDAAFGITDNNIPGDGTVKDFEGWEWK